MKTKKELSEFMKSVDSELAQLRHIVELIEAMNYGAYGAKERTIHYLASRYEDFLPNKDE